MHVRSATRLLCAAVLSIATLLAGEAPAAASDVDLGQPATMTELLASPEYRNDHAGVLRLYLAFLDRQPDVTGSAYWIDRYTDGLTEDDLAWGFAQSGEFADRYGTNLDNASFLDVVYSNVLGRSPDPAGFSYWLDQMNSGLAKHAVVRWIAANHEFIQRAPFTRTSPDLTSALVTARDVDPALIAYVVDGPLYSSSDVPTPVTCDQPLVLPDNANGTFYIEDVRSVANLTKPAITNDVYGFSDPSRAAAMVAEIRRVFPSECSGYVDGFGGTNTRKNVTVPATCASCVMWETTNVSPAYGGRVWFTRSMAIQVGYAISIVEVGNWTRPSEAELVVQANRVRARLETQISN